VFEFRIVTLFKELFAGFVDASLIGKARRSGLISIELIDLRDFTHDRHRTVDDAPYGGGSGMVMKTAPILEMLAAQPPCRRVLMTPQGRPFDQARAHSLATCSAPLLLFCGRYEGVDERVRAMFDEEVSLGDFVLNGGEVAAMAVIEAVSRLVPGVLGNAESVVEESFTAGLLEYPQYTRPEIVNGEGVPEILLSGDHGRVALWRRGQALLRTKRRRPDLFARREPSPGDEALLARAEGEDAPKNREEP
jgi:tRNA (guanine37-N1)-methyltransferase